MQPDLPRVQQATALSWALGMDVGALLNSQWKAAAASLTSLRLWPHQQASSQPAQVAPPSQQRAQHRRAPQHLRQLPAGGDDGAPAFHSPFGCSSPRAAANFAAAWVDGDSSDSLKLRRQNSSSASLESRRAARRFAIEAAAAGDLNAARHAAAPGVAQRASPRLGRLRAALATPALPVVALAAAALGAGAFACTAGYGRLLRGLAAYTAAELAFQAWQRWR